MIAGGSIGRGSTLVPNTRPGSAEKLAKQGQMGRGVPSQGRLHNELNLDSQERIRAPGDVLCLSWNPTRYDENKVRALRVPMQYFAQ